MRLIDADKIKIGISEKTRTDSEASRFIDIINAQPTAFDLESVIEKFRNNEKIMFSILEKELDKELVFAVQKLFRTYTDSQIETLKSAANATNGKNGG